jgi:hypothetical protein
VTRGRPAKTSGEQHVGKTHYLSELAVQRLEQMFRAEGSHSKSAIVERAIHRLFEAEYAPRQEPLRDDDSFG